MSDVFMYPSLWNEEPSGQKDFKASQNFAFLVSHISNKSF